MTKGQSLLINRMSLRAATAVGSAALVAGAAFAVSAFADSGTGPEQATAAATPAIQQEEEDGAFFEEGEESSEEDWEELLAEAEERRHEAVSAARAAGASSLDGQEEEEEEEEEESPEAPSGGEPASPGSNRDIARSMLGDFGWGDGQWSCLDSLWEHESNWDHTAQNASSGAYGIPQALPGDKMADSGSDWQTNPATQIDWGLNYIEGRYGSPCDAWAHFEANNWY